MIDFSRWTLLDNAALEPLKDMGQLTSLNLAYCQQLTDEALLYVKELRNLRSLNLSGLRQITDEGIECLSDLPLGLNAPRTVFVQ